MSTYSADEMNQMLVAGAGALDRTYVRAAVHLLTFTAMTGRAAFGSLVEIETPDGQDGPQLAAFVKDWKALPTSQAADRLGGADQRLLALAVSLAAGERVDLGAAVSAGGHAFARRVIEAVAIGTGYGRMYAVTPTPALDEMLATNQALTRC